MTGRDFKIRRVKLDMTQAELAKELGIQANTISRYETEELSIPKAVELALETVDQRKRLKQFARENDRVVAERSVNYGMWRYHVLDFEVRLLAIEYQGLVETAIKLTDFKKENLEPILEKDLRYDDLYWKWSDQISRYYANANAVSRILHEKAKQIKDMLNATNSGVEKLGFEMTAKSDVEKEIKRWDSFLENFENKET